MKIKHKYTIELVVADNEIIGVKEQIAAALENIGTAHIVKVETV